ncbi:GLPGLI family protein [Pedobacter metabolipauper]|uniref:GLPGLI family protein n=1 Tax=Pedobacter metabolipauper TaxID=425513 RepID=A0A4R6SXU3_9SPHI|nr:GLPGLI family protein [Pedobacter metabolipauper]TDQ09295.1 GLPGLI family protein [Pedobacter metabolipauper]
MKNKTLLLICLIFAGTCLKAQNARFPTDGIIEFEKSTNMHALIKKMTDGNPDGYFRDAFDAFKKNNPQFRIQKSTLAFSKSKTLFTPLADKETSRSIFSDFVVDQCNITYTDLAAGTFITQKKVYEETFLVKDTTRKINWKITSEVRTIAGYECRRANAVILDSIYVVAFYTDKIPVSGGPESFTGLPGMILGVALPHENVTWFAKMVTDRSLTANELKVPAKGKATDNKGLRATINSALKDWGEYAQSALKTFLL